MENSKIDALTPEQATRIVENGGLVCNQIYLWWYDGILLRSSGGGSISPFQFPAAMLPHPAYDHAVFARGYPLTLPGPEAKALLMQAPLGMLWGCHTDYLDEFEKFADYWTSEEFTGEFMDRWSWSKHHIYQVRIRPDWLSSQRARFARGEFGEQQETKETPMPTPTIYLPDSPPVTFPWQGTGAECVRIWNAAPEGMLEWSISKIMWGSKPLKGDTNATYHLRPRADYRAPQPGDVVDAAEAWKLVWQGWVVEGTTRKCVYFIKDGELYYSPYDGAPHAGVMQAGKQSMTEGPYTLLRHKPWSTASLATGYVWTGKDVLDAMDAGLEGLLEGGDLQYSVRKVTGGYHRFENGKLSDSGVWRPESIKRNNWALRWPVTTKEEDMETKDETLSGWDLLKCIQEGEVWGDHNIECRFMDGKFQARKQGTTPWNISSVWLNDFLSSTFTRVPVKPSHKAVTLDSGMQVVVYADRVEADVPGCGKWLSTRERYETALKCEGAIEVRVLDFAKKDGTTFYMAHTLRDGVCINNRTVTFADIRRVLSAMQEVEG